MSEAAQRSSIARRAIPAALTLFALAVLGLYLWSRRTHIAEQFAFDPRTISAMVALTAATVLLRAIGNRVLFGRLGVDASLTDWFAVASVHSFTNYLPLSAGLFAKAFYLKRVHGVSLADFGVAQVALLLLFVATNGVVGVVAAWYWVNPADAWIAAAFAAMALGGSVVLLPIEVTRPLAKRVERWFPWNERTAAAIRSAAIRVIPIQICVIGLTAWILQLGFSMGPTRVGFAACTIFSAATLITRIVSLTPGAIGIREFLIGGLAVATGFELDSAVVAATAVRVAEMLAIFALGGAFTFRLSNQIAATYES